MIYVLSLMFREISQFELSIFIPICALDISGSLRIRAWYYKLEKVENDATKTNFGEDFLRSLAGWETSLLSKVTAYAAISAFLSPVIRQMKQEVAMPPILNPDHNM